MDFTENTFKNYYFNEHEDEASDEEGTLAFKVKQAIAKKRPSNNIDVFFEKSKKKPKVYKKSSTVAKMTEDGVAYLTSGQDDGAYASHLIKIEVYDMEKIKNVSPLEHWKHCDLRVRYYTVGEGDTHEQSARDVIYNITKELSAKPKCVKYCLGTENK
ncbi:uncharacterized protein LOC133533729 [Cydia pomonella]|uniref:uncharacterized protein LOC133518957 n=1 Tax=Cydia pomonella TaxID=82600 RepID=UPI002ADD3C89|nr:uncharacterized protein LOC133518957 [Cydia pomonella]XP_061709217.1 uncharacterized protein LOC133519240 [Cydia pomonella]XP_061710520.1 uncharacterized protein LOC133520165 [Cydia pomonella]XP_061715683.1 uncharacterized protein LOC133523965 [Cydia pomonella]XP_061721238.1 uncharacterized protein LOC133528013 [Cydia pomonella]XP_061723706.1 uncharacterized protein LOC133529939 [Cydia pomonella]XP_061727322.1 uncharacterized protein LOC133532592 [Cydia pomonella]XP_061728747.1 uncharacte